MTIFMLMTLVSLLVTHPSMLPSVWYLMILEKVFWIMLSKVICFLSNYFL